MVDYEIGRCTSVALTEVRTVLHRAKTALLHIPTGDSVNNELIVRGEIHARHLDKPREVVRPHPELDEMIVALEQVVSLLERWRRTGQPKR